MVVDECCEKVAARFSTVWGLWVFQSLWKCQKSKVWMIANRYWCSNFSLTPSERKTRAVWNFIAGKSEICFTGCQFLSAETQRNPLGNPPFFDNEISSGSSFSLRRIQRKSWTSISIRNQPYFRFLTLSERLGQSHSPYGGKYSCHLLTTLPTTIQKNICYIEAILVLSSLFSEKKQWRIKSDSELSLRNVFKSW